jgi:hypothetical protein
LCSSVGSQMVKDVLYLGPRAGEDGRGEINEGVYEEEGFYYSERGRVAETARVKCGCNRKFLR